MESNTNGEKKTSKKTNKSKIQKKNKEHKRNSVFMMGNQVLAIKISIE